MNKSKESKACNVNIYPSGIFVCYTCGKSGKSNELTTDSKRGSRHNNCSLESTFGDRTIEENRTNLKTDRT